MIFNLMSTCLPKLSQSAVVTAGADLFRELYLWVNWALVIIIASSPHQPAPHNSLWTQWACVQSVAVCQICTKIAITSQMLSSKYHTHKLFSGFYLIFQMFQMFLPQLMNYYWKGEEENDMQGVYDSPPSPNKNNLDRDDCGFTTLPDP